MLAQNCPYLFCQQPTKLHKALRGDHMLDTYGILPHASDVAELLLSKCFILELPYTKVELELTSLCSSSPTLVAFSKPLRVATNTSWAVVFCGIWIPPLHIQVPDLLLKLFHLKLEDPVLNHFQSVMCWFLSGKNRSSWSYWLVGEGEMNSLSPFTWPIKFALASCPLWSLKLHCTHKGSAASLSNLANSVVL